MKHREHPFDRYAPFTDAMALKEVSSKPLRKSVRVNTLKCSLEQFRAWAMEKGWELDPVPWCREGFFVERPLPLLPDPPPRGEGNIREALGRDLLHLLGGFYMQEAASMLPVELLDPKPGETVLDLCAAPGSKATQIAARMILHPHPNPLPLKRERGDVYKSYLDGADLSFPLPSEGRGQGEGCVRGVIVANDIQEKRLWTLKSALHRSGVTNVLVTKKVGQWFSKHMTERFDRVLCDAPCTAQGTSRKDSDALLYSSLENVTKMARLQEQLLEAAIHAAKVGGRIVYSTCTLTPEENELVVMKTLNKFCDQLSVLNPSEILGDRGKGLGVAIEDSNNVQKYLHSSTHYSLPTTHYPFLRLWPQTFNTEGFFCAVLEKKAPTRLVEGVEWVPFQERELSPARACEISKTLEEQYGCSFLEEEEFLFERGRELYVTGSQVSDFKLPTKDYSLGLPFGKLLSDGAVLLSHEVATLRGSMATRNVCDVDEQEVAALLRGRDIPCDSMLRGHVLVRFENFCIGRGLAKEGKLKNNVPRWMIFS